MTSPNSSNPDQEPIILAESSLVPADSQQSEKDSEDPNAWTREESTGQRVLFEGIPQKNSLKDDNKLIGKSVVKSELDTL